MERSSAGIRYVPTNIRTVFIVNLLVQKLNKSSRLGPSRSMTNTFWSRSWPNHLKIENDGQNDGQNEASNGMTENVEMCFHSPNVRNPSASV